ncbi:MAG: DMT family transporter [Alphaproteobacteria bacterium]|nr:DMT family transporter [Alphaproteobacteria bacterium]
MSARAWLLLLLLSVVWGGSFICIKIAVVELPPLTVVLLRVALAAFAMLAVLPAVGLAMPRQPGVWRDFLVLGLINNLIPFGLMFWALTHIEAGLAAILNAATPLFTILLAHLLTEDERAGPRKFAGVALGMSGVAVMVGIEALAGLGTAVLAQLAMLAGTCSYAFAGLFGRRFAGRPALVTATGQMVGSSLLTLPLVLAIDRPWTLAWPSAEVWIALGVLAVICTAFGYWLYFLVLQLAGATNLLLVTLLIPVSSLLLSAAILDEQPAPTAYAGMALIACGLAVIDGRLLARLTSSAAKGDA